MTGCTGLKPGSAVPGGGVVPPTRQRRPSDAGGDEADLARPQPGTATLGVNTYLLHLGATRRLPSAVPGRRQAGVLDPHQDDDAEILVVPAVDQKGPWRGAGRPPAAQA